MVTLDSVLNVAIPAIIIVIFGFLLYRPFHDMFKQLFSFIGNMIGYTKDRMSGGEDSLGPKSLEFE